MSANTSRRRAPAARSSVTSTSPAPAPDPIADLLREHFAAVEQVIARVAAGQRPSRDDVDAVKWAQAACRDTRVVCLPPRFRLPSEGRRPDEITPAFRLVSETLRVVERAIVLIAVALGVDAAELLSGDIGAPAWTIARERAGIVESAKPPAPVDPLPTLGIPAAVALRLLRLSPNVRQTVTALAKIASAANTEAARSKPKRPPVFAVQSGNRILAGLRELKAHGLAEEPNAPKHDGWALTEAGRTFAIPADGLPGSC